MPESSHQVARHGDERFRDLPRLVPYLILVVTTLVGILLRVHRLGSKPLWFDEAVVYWIAQADLETSISLNASGNSAPPLFVVALNLLTTIGTTEGWLRLLPVVASALCIPAMYFLGREFLTETAALLPALIIAVAPVQIQYAQQVREYSLSVLLAILLFTAGASFVKRPTLGRAGALAGTVVISVFTQYGLALLAAGLSIVTFLAVLKAGDGRKTAIRLWAAVQVVSIGAAILVYQVALREQFVPGGWGGSTYLASGYWAGGTAQSAISFVYRGARDLIGFAFGGSIFLLTFLVGAIHVIALRTKRFLVLLLVLPFVVTAGAGLLRLYPLVSGRQDLFLTPAIYLAASIGLAYAAEVDRKHLLPAVLVLFLLRAVSYPLSDYYESEGMSSVGRHVSVVAGRSSEKDLLYVCNLSDPVIRYYIEVRYPGLQPSIRAPEPGTQPEDFILEEVSDRSDTATRWVLLDPSCGDTRPLLEGLYRTHRTQLIDQGVSSTLLRAN
jgi:uncharacterized membrane protein